MRIGPYSLYQVVIDHFRLDGGAMFGSVPKPLWERRIPADAQNGILLACRALVLVSDSKTILIETGCGANWAAKQKEIYKFSYQLDRPMRDYFSRVTDVVFTHLHFDHAGGSVYPENGAMKLSFPNATHHVQKKNWERALNPGVREKATYLPEMIATLKNSKLSLHENREQIFPGVTVNQFNGHTDGLQGVLISDGSLTLAFPSDLIPTAHHLSLPYVMGYDLCASTTLKEKEEFLEQAIREQFWVTFGHDADTCMVKVGKDERGAYCAREKAELPIYRE